jgi:hypothetical protein
MKPTGYLVMESCEDYEQALCLRSGNGLPDGGILDWDETNRGRAVFYTRQQARAAIDRTEHYRLAFGRTDLPEKKFCGIAPVLAVPASDGEQE